MPLIEDFAKTLKEFHDNGTVFNSPQNALYAVTEIEETRCKVDRLTANEPVHINYGLLESKLALVQENGGQYSFPDLVHTAAIRTSLLQSHVFGLSLDRKTIFELSDTQKALHHFCTLIQNLKVDISEGTPRIYKPVLVACVLEGMQSGDLTENRIDFDWLLSCFSAKMDLFQIEAGPQQAAYAFYSLSNELWWLISYNNIHDRLHDPVSPSKIREKVHFVSIKNTYWNALRSNNNIAIALDALEKKWWPKPKTLSEENMPTPRYWFEKTLVHNRIDRLEGPHAFGKALWSPQQSESGGDIYKNMREIKPGDVILHLTDNKHISGISLARETFQTEFDGQPFRGAARTDWSDRPCYRVPVHEFVLLDPPLNRSDFLGASAHKQQLLKILSENTNLFYNKKLDLNQGKYLTPGPLELIELLNRIYLQKTGRNIPHINISSSELQVITKQSTEVSPLIERNLILYGPPGTGKTFQTANIAVKICDLKVPDNRHDLMLRYRELVAEKRISFVAFHQSYSYEEFIEGIRPDMVKGEDTEEEKLVYKVEDGLFKKVCRMATDAVSIKKRPSGLLDSLAGRKFYKMSIGGKLDPEVEEYCLHNNYLGLGWGGDVDFSKIPKEKNWDIAKKAIKALMETEQSEYVEKPFAVQAMYWFKNAINIGDIVIISRGLTEAQAIGVVEGEYEYKPELLPGMGYEHFRKVRWLITDAEIPVEKIQNKIFSQMSIYSFNENSLKMDYLTDLLCSQESHEKTGTPERYVLIIDEINRGNISKILGELITLLEPDKRLDEENEIRVTLPYSRKEFGVPSNLYIIATMNTADRSIAFMDTALRRRFHFQEVMPDIKIIKENVGNKGVLEGVDISKLLATLNNRIEILYDRDHQLGHSYFMKVKSLKALRTTFRDKVIPLLQEYFYEDWEKLCAVLGCPYDPETGKPTSGKAYKYPIIKTEGLDASVIPGYDHDDYVNRLRYFLNDGFKKAKDNELSDYFNAIIDPKQIENNVDEETA